MWKELTDASSLPGRRLPISALQLLRESPKEGLGPHAPWTAHTLPRRASHHQGHPLYCCVLRRSLTGRCLPASVRFFSSLTTTAQQPRDLWAPRNPVQPPIPEFLLLLKLPVGKIGRRPEMERPSETGAAHGAPTSLRRRW